MRPIPTEIMHFTHISHLQTVIARGLLSDARAQSGLLQVEVGHMGIKEQRRQRMVSVGPHQGVVADYVPFYFAPRSPMLCSIHYGNVDTYTAGCDELIYLVTSIEVAQTLGALPILSDRNASLRLATFSADPAAWDKLVDWPLMQAAMWTNTPELPDRKERRMAECLIHGRLPWAAFSLIVVKSDALAQRVRTSLVSVGVQATVSVRPNWYF